ncbi:MAG: aminopeptidase [Candidatus Eisenbacteria bacterium]
MRDPRTRQLAKLIVNHSCELKAGETVLIESFDLADGLVLDLIEETQAVGAIPVVSIRDNGVIRAQLRGATEAQLQVQANIELHQMKQVQAYVGIRASSNVSELADVPADRMGLYQQIVAKPVHLDYRVNHTRWVVLRYPNAAMAQLANLSTEAFEDFYFKVCNVDYARMRKAMQPLVDRMKRTDRVHIKSPGTDLRFSIKDIGVIPCFGERNIPDGECFTAPVRDSVEGTIAYNTPSVYLGTTYDRLTFTFEKGKIVKATGNPQDKLEKLLDTDEGARYIGEFSLGFNPHVLHPMKDTLFDEKIAGSLHFTPGQCYETTENGNRSRVHWDLVLIQRPEYGGGEIWFDGERIRKDGLFVVDDLKGLNPDALGQP